MFRGTNASDRNGPGNLLRRFLCETVPHVGGDGPRGDGVDANVLLGELQRDRFGQAFDRVLGSDVNADLRETDMPSNAGIISQKFFR